MSKLQIGTHIEAFGKSLHKGHKGTIVADYINMLLVKADDPKYILAHGNTIGEGKYFQIDRRYYKELKDAKNK